MNCDEFFRFIETNAGPVEVEILKVQNINNIKTLLRSTDLFSFFQLECDELAALRKKCLFQVKRWNIRC